MVRPAITSDDQKIETYEITTGGTVWVWVFNKREDRFEKKRVGGRSGSRLLHITRDDRKHNQEQNPVENSGMDPFTNGSLRLITESDRDDTLDMRHHLTDGELEKYFEVRDKTKFRTKVDDVASELIIRRLMSLAEDHGTVAQTDVLRDIITARYPIGGTQRTVREMMEAGERLNAARL
jgi:hypothetical protein